VIADIQKKYKLTGKPMIIGGFSLGGSGAVKYAELSMGTGSKSIKPAMLFAGDPPLDLERMNFMMERTIRRNSPAIGVSEAKFIQEKMISLFGPDKTNWYKHSVFLYSDTTNTLIKNLTELPVRLYSEPDIEWMMQNRHYDYYSSNSLDCAAMINELQLTGSTTAAFIATTGKGIRANGKRHPHSWSIIDGGELVNWIKNYLKI
jgi:hypothetical protein